MVIKLWHCHECTTIRRLFTLFYYSLVSCLKTFEIKRKKKFEYLCGFQEYAQIQCLGELDIFVTEPSTAAT